MATQAIWHDAGLRERYARWRRAAADADAGSPFRRLLGDAWFDLPEAVRARFARHIAAGACISYVGEVVECRMSLAGRLLAQVARLIGAPLPLSTDIGVAACVSVTGDLEGGAQYWTRQYARRHGFPQVIHSAKRFAGPTGIEEYLGLGLGIALRLRVADGALLFESDHYFLGLPGRRLRVPCALVGRLTVGHVEIGDGRFAFTLDLVHPWFGQMIHQLAVFADADEART
jgi:hypothetical protein